ncbi:MAG: type I restriction enzyme HsdR N-terminal domain-containing protein [Rikenellaceae bacterium]|nr:type I restriction enzyme HsdR N-terminal domain-containing protein [Rikenellaceae bacterium]MBO7343439.1 type I restriction enzyme HsdR N-terminal domain-containing protein [Alistipes sp.]
MNSLPKLNFPAINLRATKSGNRTLVFDRVRGMFVVLTPEEWVRRHLVEYLIEHCGAALRSIVEEYPVQINSMPQRADVVVLNAESQPLLLAECKSSDVNLDRRETLAEVFTQATRYNAMVKARYIIITNGQRHFCYEATENGYVSLSAFPRLG